MPSLARKIRHRRTLWRRYGWRRLVGVSLHDLRWKLASDESTSRWIDERLLLGDDDYWLFVLGLNNSGTSIVTRVLAHHPRVRRLPEEGQALTTVFPRGNQYGVARVWTQRLDVYRLTEDDDPAPARRAMYDWLYYYQPRPGILLEKSPPNTIRGRWLQHNFRPSRFIAVTRHPYAVCEGIRRRTGLPIEQAARHWLVGNELLLADIDQLERALTIRYEDFCERPREQLERMQSFLELQQPLDYELLQQPLRVHNIDGTAQPLANMNAKSIERLSQEDIAEIDRVTAPLRERLGYESVLDPR
jgi:hypothetical protein